MSINLDRRFFKAMEKLERREQSAVHDFVMKFLKDPQHPSHNLERVQSARRSQGTRSARVNDELRVILFATDGGFVLSYVGHHEAAYEWAKRNYCERNPVTNQLQLVEIPEISTEAHGNRVETVGMSVPKQTSKIFDSHSDAYLRSLGVPINWLPFLRKLESVEEVFDQCYKLPDDVYERLVELAEGKNVSPPVAGLRRSEDTTTIQKETEDRRSGLFWPSDQSLIEATLKWPFDQWIAFLHPTQSELVEAKYLGPTKISGSAGTGKTVVAMHRARVLAERGHQVLLTTYTRILSKNIFRNLRKMCDQDTLKRITVTTIQRETMNIVQHIDPKIKLITDKNVDEIIRDKCNSLGLHNEFLFVKSEWHSVLRAQGLETWEGYQKAIRTGRSRALRIEDRKRLWNVFESTLEELRHRRVRDRSGMAVRAHSLLNTRKYSSPYTGIIVDEVQDLQSPELRFLLSLAGEYRSNLMLLGDTRQRIYPGGFSLSALGIETRGRSHVLRLSYRTTRQIRQFSERLLDDEMDDMNGSREQRVAARSVTSGPDPQLIPYATWDSELEGAIKKISEWRRESEEIGILTRTNSAAVQVCEALARRDIPHVNLKDQQDSEVRRISVGTMHSAKGLEFRFVLVVNCSEDALPSPGLMREATSPTEAREFERRERRLLYVAMTRARDELVVSWHGRPSRLLGVIS